MTDDVTLVTSNDGKAREFTRLLGIEVTTTTMDLVEIQSLDVAAVAERKAADAYAQLRRPVLVDDSGLALAAWNGLPGALIACFLDTVGVHGLLAMATGLTNRRATVTTALGYADATGVHVVTGAVHGTLTTEPRGSNGFSYDTVFVPASGTQTFAEMPNEQKNEISPRRLATDALRAHLGLADPPTPCQSSLSQAGEVQRAPLT
ncbi:non-canonical purine NTP pyrophosphatase [Frankia sp. R82]|uniref:non-canonical purine NTP pyrophosphatase n=1 Tax=Frankia sp. R82 TaxID=2950553 RepID=UPI002044A108|nr:non-canonical purine NTP pyrophosphatase [Frankia sp. R82]MCM3883084.1 non-canonical purine NTP pyrophosphatase [Frankia sp. R82]